MKILIMGLPGSGKTTLAKNLLTELYAQGKPTIWYNADYIRKTYNDWDFSIEGRFRQAQRMAERANTCKHYGIITICDFVCPTESLRKLFNPDVMIWMDTIKESEYEDTNKMFEPPTSYTFRITDFNQEDDVIEKLVAGAGIEPAIFSL